MPDHTGSTASGLGPELPNVVEWRPGRSEAITWNVVGLLVTLISIPGFAMPSVLRGLAGGSVSISLGDVVLVVGITLLLVIGHEGIHGMLMRGFGARPRFGATLVGRFVPALYATAAGHHFSRSQYLAIAVAPGLLVSGLGLWACFGPWAGYLILPLALHLGGCVGDGFAAWRVLKEPASTQCEDLIDGIRFHHGSGVAMLAPPAPD